MSLFARPSEILPVLSKIYCFMLTAIQIMLLLIVGVVQKQQLTKHMHKQKRKF